YELVDGKAAAPKIDDCIECCVCVSSCPNGAIEHSSC
ncbi:MAG: 4Fe-4S ferredoxin, partial [Thermoplasmata archaeon]